MKKASDKGFTLVELLVILIILAILSALLVPTLMGYIDEARAKKYLPNAKTALEAAQSMFSRQYGLNDHPTAGDTVVPDPLDTSTSGNKDQDITNTQFAADVLKLAGLPDESPYLFMVGVGSIQEANGSQRLGHTVTEQDKYTIYYAVYIESEGSKAWYYYNGSWTTKNPRYKNTNFAFDSNNVVLSGKDKGVKIQYYLISNHNPDVMGKDKSVKTRKFWDWLKAME